jgi:hypothetical protein
MSFNVNDFANEYCTVEEVLEIKRAFDLFDRDLGGAIDPRGTFKFTQNSRLLLTHSVSRPRHKPFIK